MSFFRINDDKCKIYTDDRRSVNEPYKIEAIGVRYTPALGSNPNITHHDLNEKAYKVMRDIIDGKTDIEQKESCPKPQSS